MSPLNLQDPEAAEQIAKALPADAIEALTGQRLGDLVRYASARSPFYRSRLGSLARAFLAEQPIGPDGVHSADAEPVRRNLALLPVVQLAELARDGARVLTDPRVSVDQLRSLARNGRSSGRSICGGTAFRFVCGANATHDLFLPFNEDEWHEQTAALLHRTSVPAALTRPRRPRVVSFTSPHAAGGPERLLSKLGLWRRVRTKILHLPATAGDADARRIYEFDPTTLWGPAGPVEVFASHVIANGWRTSVEWVVVPAGDLTRSRRALIQKAFPLAHVIAWLGASLGLPIAASCLPHGTLHIVADHFIVEPVDRELRPVPMGVEGSDVLMTALRLRTFPILRVLLPFRARLLPSCPCGSALPPLELEGHDGDLVWMADHRGDLVPVASGNIVERLKLLPGVADAEAHLAPNGSLRVTFATNVGFRNDHVAAQVLTELNCALRGWQNGARFRLTVEEVAENDASFNRTLRPALTEDHVVARPVLTEVK
ncbi:MAG: hypothetical protein HYY84_04920 [Deltaproteobacteria bacterium]|nr:hypothetical protein [Deltaproteobacteria bacterium]